MKRFKIGILLLAILLLFSSVTAQLQFKTDNPIDYFSSIDMNNNQIANLSDPVNGGDAIPLDYIQGQFLERDGDTMDGTLYLNGDPGNNTLVSYGNILSRGAAGAITLKANDKANHTYMEFFTDNTSLETRSAWLGFGNDEKKSLSLANEIGEYINLKGGTVRIADGNLSMNGNAITNIDWSASDNPATNLEALSTGTGLSGTSYNGSSSSTWSVNWGDAYDLNNNGGITDFSNANDLDNNGNLNPTNNLNMNDNNINNVNKFNGVKIDTIRVESRGNSADKTGRGVWINGDKVFTPSRSYGLVVIDRNTHEVSFSSTYDVFGSASEAKKLGDKLQSLSNEKIVIITTYDEPQQNRLQNSLPSNITRVGGSGAFQSSNFEYRSAYILVGIPGLDKGQGFEKYRGDERSDPEAHVTTTFSLTNGWPTILPEGNPYVRGLGAGRNMDMNNNQVENVGTPDQSSDAATKGYVDSNSGGELVFTGTYTSSSSRKCTTEYDGSVSVSTTASCSDPDAFIAGYRKYSLSHTTEDSTSGYCSRDHLSSSYPNGYTNWDTKKSQSSMSTSSSADHYEYGGSMVQAQVRIVCAKYN